MQPSQRLAYREAADTGDVGDLRGTEGMEPDFRMAGLEAAEELFVKGDVEAGVQAALQQQLVAAQPQGLLYLGVIGFGGRDVGGALAGPAVEIAELTARDADVGDVDVAVYLPGHGTGLFHCTAAQCVGQAEKPCGRDRFVEPQRFVESERHPVERFAADGFEIHRVFPFCMRSYEK